MKLYFLILQAVLLVCLGAKPVYAELPAATADFIHNEQVDISDFAVLSASWTTAFPWSPDGLLPQMIAHWAMDMDATDSQLIFDGAVAGNPTWFSKNNNPNDVKIGSGAVGLDGQDYIEINASEFPHFYGSLTIEAWIKTNYTLQSQSIVSKGSSSWQIGIEAGTGKAFFSCPGLSGTHYLIGNTSLSDGYWHHIAGVYDYDNEQIALYHDGSIDAQASATGQMDKNDLNIWIGGNPQTADSWWHGTIDNLCIFNDALTCQQVFQRQTYHVDVNNGVDNPGGHDPEWGKGRQKAFKTIQHAIDAADDSDIILVWPGIYRESLFFMGKAVTVRSAADAAILQSDPADTEKIAVTFMYGEQSGSVLEHFVIVNSNVALWINQSSPTLRHLTIVNNNYGIEAIFNSRPTIEHSIFWNNAYGDIAYDTYTPAVSYSCLQQPYPGIGNISGDPLFVNPNSADPNTMDFHVQSEYGRYLPNGTSVPRPQIENWAIDHQTSPCIDVGCPTLNPFCETMSNGGRINIGAYGNTPFAGKSPWGLPADLNHNGDVYLEDLLLFSEQWLNVKSL